MANRVTADTSLYQEFRIDLRVVRDDLLAARVVVSPLGESNEVQFPIPLARGAIEEALASISYAGQDYLKRSAGPNNYDQIGAMGRVHAMRSNFYTRGLRVNGANRLRSRCWKGPQPPVAA